MDEGRDRTKIDLRVVKSCEAIRGAFEKLLETTEYTNITVSALAREARISRKTFYAHFTSVDDLLRQMVKEQVANVVREIQPDEELRGVEEWLTEFTRLTLASLRDSPHLENNVIRCLPVSSLLEMVRTPLLDICECELRKRNLQPAANSDELISFYLGGLCAVYETWSISGRNPETLDDIAEHIAQTAAHGLCSILEA